ncbi:unnamed protein product [Durusdinium trenchii]|uniref:Uncharacterized protein n=2 Tax=Durusdinium trenchii TaxID=1381693 RepID=A0ABP0HYZ8_9DINO
MVTAAKVQQAQASKDAQAAMAASTSAGAPSGPSHEATYVSGGSTSSRQAFRMRMEYESSQASSEEAEVPMSFGEQLVLETYLRFRGRRYDRQRQEELSQPRRIKPPADHWTGGRGRKVLEKEQLDDMLKRLAEPKRGKATDSGELIALHSSKQEIVKQRVQAKDVEATFARLSAPKTRKGYDPSPGEKVCLMYNQASGRNVNLERLADMAKPKKRGGAPDSWAVTAMAQKAPAALETAPAAEPDAVAGTNLETSIENPPLVPGNGASSSSGGEQGPASASDDVLLVARKLSRD